MGFILQTPMTKDITADNFQVEFILSRPLMKDNPNQTEQTSYLSYWTDKHKIKTSSGTCVELKLIAWSVGYCTAYIVQRQSYNTRQEIMYTSTWSKLPRIPYKYRREFHLRRICDRSCVIYEVQTAQLCSSSCHFYGLTNIGSDN